MSNAVTSGLGWLTKLILWGLVVVVGLMYLRAVPHKGHETAVQAPTARVAPAGTPMPAAVATKPAPAAIVPAPTQAKPDSQPAPVERAESAAFANTLMSPQPATAPAPRTPPAPVGPPAAYVPATPANVPPSPAMPAPEAPQAAVPGQMPQAPAVETQRAPGMETIEQRRARVFAELQQMRRAAQEEMRKHWEGMGATGPMPPYGYPGYAPAPGYGPGPYAPR